MSTASLSDLSLDGTYINITTLEHELTMGTCSQDPEELRKKIEANKEQVKNERASIERNTIEIERLEKQHEANSKDLGEKRNSLAELEKKYTQAEAAGNEYAMERIARDIADLKSKIDLLTNSFEWIADRKQLAHNRIVQSQRVIPILEELIKTQELCLKLLEEKEKQKPATGGTTGGNGDIRK